MYVVRMFEVVKNLCETLRAVMMELDATGIFNDETWKQITAPDTDVLPPLNRLHRMRRQEHRAKPRMHGNTELLMDRLENMKSRNVLKFMRRVTRFELWIQQMGRTPTACRWPDRDRWPYKDKV